MQGEWSRYRGGHFNGGRMVPCYRSGHLFNCRENGHVTEVVSLERENGHITVGGQFNGGRIIMLQRWIVSWRENGPCLQRW